MESLRSWQMGDKKAGRRMGNGFEDNIMDIM